MSNGTFDEYPDDIDSKIIDHKIAIEKEWRAKSQSPKQKIAEGLEVGGIHNAIILLDGISHKDAVQARKILLEVCKQDKPKGGSDE